MGGTVGSEQEPIRVVLLANQPRMFREMLHRALDKIPGSQLILETERPQQVLSILARVEADWLIVTLTAKGKLPKLVEEAIEQNPSLSVLGFSEDIGHVEVQMKMHSNEDRERRHYLLKNISLLELLSILGDDQID